MFLGQIVEFFRRELFQFGGVGMGVLHGLRDLCSALAVAFPACLPFPFAFFRTWSIGMGTLRYLEISAFILLVLEWLKEVFNGVESAAGRRRSRCRSDKKGPKNENTASCHLLNSECFSSL